MCGTDVGADVSECPGCGESFLSLDNDELAPEQEFYEKTITEEIEEVMTAPDDELTVHEDVVQIIPEDEGLAVPEVVDYCPDCESQLADDGSCPGCTSSEMSDEATDGCPICGSKSFTVESGELVSCGDCGNVYILKEFTGAEQSWKWKFWVGLIFIVVGDLGVALGSYVHNVLEWSPFGTMYLGYGWMDQLVGFVGIILFILGLVLFAWSFKREREVQCPSCKVIVLKEQLIEVEADEDEFVPEELAVESALKEIDEVVECPSCGAEVSMFDASCGDCGVLFELEGELEEEPVDDLVEELSEPIELERGFDLNDDEMTMENLELDNSEESIELNGDNFEALDELESAFDVPLVDDMAITTCPSCGVMVDNSLDACPGCGEALNGKGGK